MIGILKLAQRKRQTENLGPCQGISRFLSAVFVYSIVGQHKAAGTIWKL